MSLLDAHGVAARQHGLISAEQAAEAGLTIHKIRHLVDADHWERRGIGLFVVAGSPHTYEQDVMAAILATAGRGVASHGCAARLLGVGVPAFNDATVTITMPRGLSTSRARALGARVHTTKHLTAAERSRFRGVPVTRAARLVVDLLGAVPAATLFAVADDVLWRLRRRDEIRRTWDRIGGGRCRQQLEEVLLPWSPGPKPGSPKEISLCRVLLLHGLPRPVRQHPVVVAGRTRYLDLAYPEARLALEYDGRRDHGPRQWGADAQREDELWSVGWLRLPAGRLDLIEPGATVSSDRVRAAYASAAYASSTDGSATYDGGAEGGGGFDGGGFDGGGMDSTERATAAR